MISPASNQLQVQFNELNMKKYIPYNLNSIDGLLSHNGRLPSGASTTFTCNPPHTPDNITDITYRTCVDMDIWNATDKQAVCSKS